jgi:hypothetical protein
MNRPAGGVRQTCRMLAVRALVIVVASVAVLGTLGSAMRTVVLPRAIAARVTRVVFLAMRGLYDVRMRGIASYEVRDRVMATYAPLSLLVLLAVWLASVYLAFVGIYWGIGTSVPLALAISGSSLTTLGFNHPPGLPGVGAAVGEALIGLALLALLITYLPALYGGFKSRERLVSKLEVRAGDPPSGVELLWRYAVLGRGDQLTEVWEEWEGYFVDIEESHTSFPALAFFRSQQPTQSWVTAAGAVLDAAALRVSTVDSRPDVQAQLTMRAGYIALRRICAFFRLPFPPDPQPDDPISVHRAEYDDACARLAEAGLPLRDDRDAAWREFAGWRVNYDVPLTALSALTMAPYAPWSSDRSLAQPQRPGPLRKDIEIELAQRDEQASR